MTLHFAYGSNMSRDLMQRRCPGAQALGPARLESWRFVITVDGYASVIPCPGSTVHGVLWRVTPRDRAALDAYESLGSGLYRRRLLPVACRGRRVSALVYVGRSAAAGRPKPGYAAIVVGAARDWALPDAYVMSLARLSSPHGSGVRAVDTGESA